MPELKTILLVTLAGLALSASPGPSMLYVLSRTVGQNWRAGLASALGLALGGVILAIAAALGLTAVFAYSRPLYLTVQYAGAAYLVYLGLQMIIPREDPPPGTVEEFQFRSYRRIVAQGVLVELMNPKTVLFFVAFLPQFIPAAPDNVSLQMLVLGVLVPLTALPSDIIVCIAGGVLAERLHKKRRAGAIASRAGALLLIGLGVRALLL